MTNHFKLYSYVVLISFAGSLPVGTLNAQIANLSTTRHFTDALFFGLGAILVEMLLVRIAIVTVQQLNRFKHLFRLFSIIATLLLLLFAFISLNAAIRMQTPDTIFPYTRQHPFIAGLLLSAANPLHLPFWMGWTAVLRQKDLLADTRPAYNIYVAAIGSGTALAFLLYGIAGSLAINILTGQQNKINWAVGLALLGTGLFQGYKTWKNYISTSNS